MKFKIKDGMLLNEEGVPIAFLYDGISDEEEKILEASGEALTAINSFVEGIKSGTHKPKKAVDEFQRILDKYEIETT